MSLRTSFFAIALLMVADGCSDDDSPKDVAEADALHMDALAVAGESVALLDRTADELAVFDVGAAHGDDLDELSGLRVPLPHNPSSLVRRRGNAAEWLVVSRGLRGVDVPPRLSTVDERGELREHVLSAPYTDLQQTDDGRFAVLWFETGADDTVFAASKLAVVDLDDDATPVETSIDLEGAAPEELWLAPPMVLDGRELHFALASSGRTVSVLSLERATEAAASVTLTGDPTRAARVVDVAFLPEQRRTALVVDGLDDVFVLDFVADDGAPRGYRVAVAQHAAGRAPSAVLAAPDGVVLVLSDDGALLHSIDSSSGARTTYDLPARASRFASCARGCSHALVYMPLSAAATTVDLKRAASGATDVLSPVRLELPVVDVQSDGPGTYVRCIHDAGAITLVDLNEGTTVALGVDSRDVHAAEAGDGDALWLAPQGASLVTQFAPSTGVATEVLLRAPIAGFALVPEAESAVVVHTEPRLAFTILPLEGPSLESAHYVEARLE